MRSPSEVDVWDALFDTHSVGMVNPLPKDEGHTHTYESARAESPRDIVGCGKRVKVPDGCSHLWCSIFAGWKPAPLFVLVLCGIHVVGMH